MPGPQTQHKGTVYGDDENAPKPGHGPPVRRRPQHAHRRTSRSHPPPGHDSLLLCAPPTSSSLIPLSRRSAGAPPRSPRALLPSHNTRLHRHGQPWTSSEPPRCARRSPGRPARRRTAPPGSCTSLLLKCHPERHVQQRAPRRSLARNHRKNCLRQPPPRRCPRRGFSRLPSPPPPIALDLQRHRRRPTARSWAYWRRRAPHRWQPRHPPPRRGNLKPQAVPPAPPSPSTLSKGTMRRELGRSRR